MTETLEQRISRLEKDLVLVYWRVASLPASPTTQPIWDSIKRIVAERGIDVEQDVELDGLAGTIRAKLDAQTRLDGKENGE